MSELRVRRRWAHWIFGVVSGGLGAFFAYVVVQSYLHPDTWGEAIRIAIPPFVLAFYWGLAITFNIRTAVVTPNRVQVTVWPFPTRRGRSISRDEMRLCYSRNILYYEDGVELGNVHTAGVETASGVRIDILGLYKTSEEALHGAHDIARVLNDTPGRKAIEVYSAGSTSGDRLSMWAVLLWGGAFLLAIIGGAAWEIASTSR